VAPKKLPPKFCGMADVLAAVSRNAAVTDNKFLISNELTMADSL
jgi:hypothetical protein